MVALTSSEKRYQQITAALEAGRLAAKLAEAEAIDGDALSHFTSVDDFLRYLDSPEQPGDLSPGWSGES
jgi:hypothetical protein